MLLRLFKQIDLMNILESIEQVATPSTVIPKPKARKDFTVKGWGQRRGERALIYNIPNHNNPYPYRKGITESEWKMAHKQLSETGEFTREWFRSAMTDCNKEGGCNFTTIGGIFELLGIATYPGHGVYVYRKS